VRAVKSSVSDAARTMDSSEQTVHHFSGIYLIIQLFGNSSPNQP